jgi:2-polyprenyl-3-methyl-5-hydroxy-6-metoxy-1,4-benzoquinol methylase
MSEHYRSEEYFEGDQVGYSSYREQESSLRLTFRRLLGALRERGLTGGTVLEIGCGHGFFLHEAEGYFRHRVGTDMSEAAAAMASGRADQVWVGGADAVPGGERFDLVLALHVVEHVYDPQTFVQRLVRLAKPGGHVLLATPDAGSFWFRWMGTRWPSFKFPEHVVFFDERTLTRLFHSAGLREMFKVPYPHAFPLAEVFRKVGIPLRRRAGKRTIWIPGTTVAMAGRIVPGPD